MVPVFWRLAGDRGLATINRALYTGCFGSPEVGSKGLAGKWVLSSDFEVLSRGFDVFGILVVLGVLVISWGF